MRRGRRSLTFAVCWLVSSSLSRCNAASWPIWAGAVSCGPAPSTAATDACFVGEDERDAGIPVVQTCELGSCCAHWVHTITGVLHVCADYSPPTSQDLSVPFSNLLLISRLLVFYAPSQVYRGAGLRGDPYPRLHTHSLGIRADRHNGPSDDQTAR